MIFWVAHAHPYLSIQYIGVRLGLWENIDTKQNAKRVSVGLVREILKRGLNFGVFVQWLFENNTSFSSNYVIILKSWKNELFFGPELKKIKKAVKAVVLDGIPM